MILQKTVETLSKYEWYIKFSWRQNWPSLHCLLSVAIASPHFVRKQKYCMY